MAFTSPSLRTMWSVLLVLGGLVCIYAGLALADVVPGGWRLRTLFVPQHEVDLSRRSAHREARLELFRAELVPEPGGTLFIGSSTIERFPLDRLLPEFVPIQRGIGDEDLAGLEQRFAETLERTQPGAVVLYAGSVNVRRAVDDGSWTSPAEIVQRVEGLVRSAGGRPIWILGILPERSTGPALARRLLETNRGLEELAGGIEGAEFLDLAREPLTGTPGPDGGSHLAASYAADELHLNESGYQVVAQWLKSTLGGTSPPSNYDSGDATGGRGASLPK